MAAVVEGKELQAPRPAAGQQPLHLEADWGPWGRGALGCWEGALWGGGDYKGGVHRARVNAGQHAHGKQCCIVSFKAMFLACRWTERNATQPSRTLQLAACHSTILTGHAAACQGICQSRKRLHSHSILL